MSASWRAACSCFALGPASSGCLATSQSYWRACRAVPKLE
jgi:hypothetical protein